MSKEKLIGLLDYLARSLVNHPQSVQIGEEETEDILTLKLRVAEDDMGRIIGKGGKTAKAIRSLIRAAGDRDGKKVVVDIVE